MAHIKSRKHLATRRLNCSAAVALAVIAIPGAAYAQQALPAMDTLPAVQVYGSMDNYKSDTVSSPKYMQPLLDTPQTITVIKKELVQEQGATTLTEALRNSPGVGTFYLGENGNTSTGDAIYMRGFDSSSSIFVDGVRDLGTISRDVFNIEQIEVSKGPNGADYGRTSPTGSINLVTKQPLLKDAYSASIGAGSASYKRATADLNKTIGDDAAVRVNLLREDSGVAGRDVVNNDKAGIAVGFGFGLKSSTRTYLDILHVEQRNVPDGGVPTIGLPGYTSPDPTRPFLSRAAPVNSSNFYGSTSDYDNVNADMFTAIVEHDIAPDLTLRNVSRYGRTAQNYMLTSFMGSSANIVTPNPADPSTWTIARGTGTPLGRTYKDQINEIISNQTNLSAKFGTGPLRHDVATGVELSHETQVTHGVANIGVLSAANLYNPNPGAPITSSGVANGTNSAAQTNTVGAYLFDTIKVGERWQYLAGGRIDRYSTGFSSVTASTATSNPSLPVGTLVPTNLGLSGNLLSWKFAALYKPAENGSVYASYATAMQPPGGSNFTLSTSANNAGNPSYDPQKARTIELGTKWDLLNKKLGLTGALYRTDVSNDIVQDPTNLQYYQIGKKQVQGIELGLVGEITPRWSASAGYTIMNTQVQQGPAVTANGSDALTYTPKQAFTAWTTYQLPAGLSLGGGARFVDSLLRGTDSAIGTPAYTNAYWVFDAMASYKVSKNLELQFNLYNLADASYVAAINKSGYRYTPGIPRSARLTANIKF